MAGSEHERVVESEHAVTPLELLFDLVFVFAITQVSSLLVGEPTWGGVLRGMLVLAAVWWAWSGYSWLTSTADVDEGGVRLAMLAASAVMLLLALAVPTSFGAHGVLFGVAFLLIRLLHLVLYAIVGRDRPDLLRALARVAPPALIGAAFLVVAGFVDDGSLRVALWGVGLAIEYAAPNLGDQHGWEIAPEHFAERYGLVVLIALGESVVAIGVGVGNELGTRLVAGAMLGMLVVSALWWLYFDVAAIFARRRLAGATGTRRARLAIDAYTYLHLVMVAGIVLFAFGLETALSQGEHELETVPAIALTGGVALYLVGNVWFLKRTTGRLFRRRTLGAGVLLVAIPLCLNVPALAAVAIVGVVCSAIVAYEAVRYRESRVRVRQG